MERQDDLWDRLIEGVTYKPLDFEELQKSHQIKKLELEKFTAYEIRLKRMEFQSRYEKDLEECSKNWMENEYRVFIWFILAYASLHHTTPPEFTLAHWADISQAFRKHPTVCRYFYLCSLKNKTEPWASQEDEFIEKMMKSKLNKKWTEIGLQLFRSTEGKNFRKPKTIRERWLSHLNPDIKRSDWTIEEDLYLIQKIKEIGRKWSKIAKEMGNRSQHTVKNRFNKIVVRRHKKDQELHAHASQEETMDVIEAELLQRIKGRQKKTKQDSTSEDQSFSGNYYGPAIPTVTTLAEAPKKILKSEQSTPHKGCQKGKSQGDGAPSQNQNEKKQYVFKPIIISLGNFRV